MIAHRQSTRHRRVAEEFTPALAAWLEGGRLAAGGPTSAPD
jgi:hypothetical protein